MCTYSVEVVDDPDFTTFIFQMILNVVVFHVGDDVFRHCLTILHLELVRVLCGAQTTKIICDICENNFVCYSYREKPRYCNYSWRHLRAKHPAHKPVNIINIKQGIVINGAS